MVAINKTAAPLAATFRMTIGVSLSHADAFQLTAPTPACQAFLYSLPAMSVTTLVVR